MLRRTPWARRADQGDENPYWISFSDLMSALLLIFILTLVVVIVRLQDQQSALTEAKQTVAQQEAMFVAQVDTLRESERIRAEMLTEIADKLAKQGIEVQVDESNSVLSIPTSLLGFESGSYEVAEAHRGRAVTIGRVVTEVISTDERYRVLDTVFVEGHTDNAPFEGLDGTGNWGLSTFRAISLWRVWESADGANRLKALRSEAGEPLFSVSGYGQTRPIEANQATESGKAKNRRIDLRFTVVRPTAADLAKIVEHEAEVSESVGR